VGRAVAVGRASADEAEGLGDGVPNTAGSRRSATPRTALETTIRSRFHSRCLVGVIGRGGAPAAGRGRGDARAPARGGPGRGSTGGGTLSERPTREAGAPRAGDALRPNVERIEEVSWRPTGSPGRVQLRQAPGGVSQQRSHTKSPQRGQKW
jgi:hypothetical protein